MFAGGLILMLVGIAAVYLWMSSRREVLSA